MQTLAPSRRAALSVLLLGTFIGVMDGFIVTVAVPSIRDDLGATFGQTQLIVAGYGTMFAAGLIVGGRFGDRYGHRRLFHAGMGTFVAASAACAAAPAPTALIAARLLQGLAAAAMLPQVLSIIRAKFPDGEDDVAIGWYGATVGLGVVCGPVLGGLLLAADLVGWGWRWIFLVNVPLGTAVLVSTAYVVPESRDPERVRMDLVGAGLASAGLVALLIPLTQGAEAGWPGWMVGCLLVAPVLIGAFVTHERRLGAHDATPLVPLRLFRASRFANGVAILFIMEAAGVAAPLLFCLTYYLQSGLGTSALRTGLVFAPVGLGFAFGSAVAPRLFARYGTAVLVAGITLIVAGLAGIVAADAGVASDVRPLALAPVLLAAGVGQGLATNPLVTLVMSSVDRTDAGGAAGIYLTTGQLASAFGLAAFGSVFLALLGEDVGRAEPVAFSHALRWTASVFTLGTISALLFVRRLHLPHSPARQG